MRRVSAFTAVVAAGMGLSACATQENFAAGLEAAKGSPALRAELIQKCIDGNKFAGEQRRLIAKTMNVSENSQVERTLCTRVMDGMISERITYDDYQRASYGQMSPKVVRVIQGR